MPGRSKGDLNKLGHEAGEMKIEVFQRLENDRWENLLILSLFNIEKNIHLISELLDKSVLLLKENETSAKINPFMPQTTAC